MCKMTSLVALAWLWLWRS